MTTPLKFSDILKANTTAESFEMEYIIPGKFNLDHLKNDFHYIESIRVQPFNPLNEDCDDLMQCDFIHIDAGGRPIFERSTNVIEGCGDKPFVKFDIDFPMSIFFGYHSLCMTLKTHGVVGELYKIIVRGIKLSSLGMVKTHPVETASIIYDHDTKYYQKINLNASPCVACYYSIVPPNVPIGTRATMKNQCLFPKKERCWIRPILPRNI
jgi:hypothetical protein